MHTVTMETTKLDSLVQQKPDLMNLNIAEARVSELKIVITEILNLAEFFTKSSVFH